MHNTVHQGTLHGVQAKAEKTPGALSAAILQLKDFYPTLLHALCDLHALSEYVMPTVRMLLSPRISPFTCT